MTRRFTTAVPQPDRKRPVLSHERSKPRLARLIWINTRRKRSRKYAFFDDREVSMRANVGAIDRIARIAIGLVLIAYAIPIGFASSGWNWVGWIGVVPILTALFGICPAYNLLGISTVAAKLVRR